jgi:uncharacterized membrane protein (UPF0127 family)
MLLAACTGAGVSGQYAAPVAEVLFPDKTRVRVEIADTEAKRARGLMFRKHLADNEGMIFLFEQPGHYPFWMQNCLISLDLIWLDSNARVVSVAQSVPPCRFPGCEPPCPSNDCPTYPPAPGSMASYVVEVAAGFAKQHGVKTGDVLELKGIGRK